MHVSISHKLSNIIIPNFDQIVAKTWKPSAKVSFLDSNHSFIVLIQSRKSNVIGLLVSISLIAASKQDHSKLWISLKVGFKFETLHVSFKVS